MASLFSLAACGTAEVEDPAPFNASRLAEVQGALRGLNSLSDQQRDDAQQALEYQCVEAAGVPLNEEPLRLIARTAAMREASSEQSGVFQGLDLWLFSAPDFGLTARLAATDAEAVAPSEEFQVTPDNDAYERAMEPPDGEVVRLELDNGGYGLLNVEGCGAKASSVLLGVPYLDYERARLEVPDIEEDLVVWVLARGEVQRANQAWSSCMKTNQFDIDTPAAVDNLLLTMQEDVASGVSDLEESSSAEMNLASTHVTCLESSALSAIVSELAILRTAELVKGAEGPSVFLSQAHAHADELAPRILSGQETYSTLSASS